MPLHTVEPVDAPAHAIVAIAAPVAGKVLCCGGPATNQDDCCFGDNEDNSSCCKGELQEGADCCSVQQETASGGCCGGAKTSCCDGEKISGYGVSKGGCCDNGKNSSCCDGGEVSDNGVSKGGYCGDAKKASCCDGKKISDDGVSEGGCCGNVKKTSCCDDEKISTNGVRGACCDETPYCDSEKDSCCDGGENKGGCCDVGEPGDDKSCCQGNQQMTDDKESIDDDSACMCCINVLVNEPALHAFVSPVNQKSDSPDRPSNISRAALSPSGSSPNDAADTTITYLEAYTDTLRSCCQALVQYCSRRACCFRSPTGAKLTSPAAPLSVYKANAPSQTLEKTAVKAASKGGQDGEDIGHGEKLQLEIRGMDCVDCVPKVGRALAQLPSVTSVNVDYFSGVAELQHDPETITSAAIANYVSRATGFGIKVLTSASGSSDLSATIITLPISFSTMPPREAFEGLDVRYGSKPRIIELLVPAHIDSPHRPREIMERLKQFGAALVPADFESRQHDRVTRDLIVVAVRTITCAVLSVPVLVLAWADLPHRPTLYGGISVGLTTLIQGIAFPLISSAFRSMVYLRQVDMSVLVCISTLTAYVFSVVSYAFQVAGKPFASPFFETTALLVTLIFLGRTISAVTRRSTGSALRELQRLQPANILLLPSVEKTLSEPQNLDARLLHYGDIIRILPETRIATDGLVVRGSSDTDESSVTGESAVVSKQPGSRVIAGTLNLGGTLDVQVTKLIHENSLARISALVRQARASRSPTQDLSDRFAAVILPAAAISAGVAFLVWVMVGLYVRDDSATDATVNALTYAIAILVVSCPCAIGLAVPTVTSVAIRLGIREGILFRSADALQTTHHIDVVAFDKTGTLTQGNFTMERAEILVKGTEQIVHALVKDNKHPISQGVLRYLSTRPPAAPHQRGGTVTEIISVPGKGVKASICGFPLLGGSPSFTGACSHPLAADLQASGLSLFTVTLAGQPIAFFGLADTPRPGADALVAELTRRGKDVMILSGDTHAAVHHLATAINILPQNVYAAYTPEDKDDAIASMQAKGRRVAFIGDGTNDGPALSRADVALAMAAGSDVALTAAGGVLLGSDIHRGVLALFDIATAARGHAHLALAWCVLYNVFAVLFASGALVKVRIEPRWAGIGEVVSVLPVITIAFGLNARWAWRRSRLGIRA